MKSVIYCYKTRYFTSLQSNGGKKKTVHNGMRFAFIMEAIVVSNLRNDVKTTKNKGFSLIELIIVIAILGIVLAIASFSWQRYVPKINLRSAARQVSADIAKFGAKAIAEGRSYTITFNIAGYNITAPAKAGNDNLPAFSLSATPVEEINAQDRQITGAVCGGGGSDLIMSARGLNNGCTVSLKNSKGSTATITVDPRGRTNVTFVWN